MPDLSLREKIDALFEMHLDASKEYRDGHESGMLRVAEVAEAHERDLVARIEAMPSYGEANDVDRRDVLALIQGVPVVKESLTTPLCPTKPENRDTTAVAYGASDATPLDERPARDHIQANFDDAHDVTIRELYRATDAVIEAIDAAANRIARVLEGRKA